MSDGCSLVFQVRKEDPPNWDVDRGRRLPGTRRGPHLGGALGTIAVITRQEIVLFIMGGVFVVETVSVMMQVAYFKWTKGRRIFRMAPLHHHFELSGWKETQVVVRFWIISMMLVLVGLSTLKIR